MLKVNDVWFKYDKKEWLLKGISFEIGPGIHCIVGKNGSGKTTLIRIIIGALKPQRGYITIYGKRIRSIKDAIGLISYVPSNPMSFLVGPTVEEDIKKAMLKANKEDTKILELVDLDGLYRKKILDLSEGQKRLV